MADIVEFEPRMLIDGKLVEGEAGAFTNVNPATEEVLGEVADASAADMHRAIDAARRAFGDAMVELTGMMTTRTVWREPAGVVGAIVPWNYPFEVTIHKLGQALATGNTVVLKPGPEQYLEVKSVAWPAA